MHQIEFVLKLLSNFLCLLVTVRNGANCTIFYVPIGFYFMFQLVLDLLDTQRGNSATYKKKDSK